MRNPSSCARGAVAPITLLVILCLSASSRAQYTVLCNLGADSEDAQVPGSGPLALGGSTLYGTSEGGGTDGTVFSVPTSGGTDTVLRHFQGSPNDGSQPYASVILSGSTLYGTTQEGGTGIGTIFSVRTDATSYSVLHVFDTSTNAADGAFPNGVLSVSGSTLYGTTYQGGDSFSGTVFSIGTSGGPITILHSFESGPSDGFGPTGAVTISGSKLYGMTTQGGTDGNGTIFSMSTAGGPTTILHSFVYGGGDGVLPHGSLTQSGSTLYGMTPGGGAEGNGTIFSIGSDGSNYQILHSFTGDDGAAPQGSLIQSGSLLYGTTSYGGENISADSPSGYGAIFSFDTDTDTYTVLHSFDGTDGQGPPGDLILSGDTLYGVTNGGGTNEGGVVFSLEVPEPSSLYLLVFAVVGTLFRRRQGILKGRESMIREF